MSVLETDQDFAERIRAQEAAWLSPLATASYPAERVLEEPGCSLRTPFQRDRDRIVHAKAFRRLKHKTQVFVAPEGDHYRTRLTHTLEVSQISRTVARALALNEDLVEAIGLGHDLGHPPFGHIGEAALDRCLRERFAGHPGFRHYEHSLRVVEVLEPLNLTEPVRDGIVHHSGRADPPATLEGAIVRLVDRVAYLNHDIDDALRAGVIARDDLPAGELAVLGDSGPSRIDTLVHDLVAHSRAAGGARRARADRAGDRDAVHALLRRSRVGARGCRGSLLGRSGDRLPCRDDRPLLRARVRGADGAARVRALMARYADTAKEQIRDAGDFERLVGARTDLRRASPSRLTGLCPFHDERTPSFSVDPVKKVFYCFGCGAAGDVYEFVMRTESLGFTEALEVLAERTGIVLEREDEDPAAAARRQRRDRLLELLDRATTFYERALWESAEAAPAREHLAARGLLEETARRFRVGYAPSAWDRLLTASQRAGFTPADLLETGLAQRSRSAWRSSIPLQCGGGFVLTA